MKKTSDSLVRFVTLRLLRINIFQRLESSITKIIFDAPTAKSNSNVIALNLQSRD